MKRSRTKRLFARRFAGFDPARFGHEIRQHLDSERVLRAAVDATGSERATIWLTTGRDLPRLAWPTPKPDSPPVPRLVLACTRRRRAVRERTAGLAFPILAPSSGLLGVLHLSGAWSREDEALLDVIAHETGFALEMANLYERAVAGKERSEAILGRVADAVIVTDGGGKIVQLNAVAEDILGLSENQASGLLCDQALGLRLEEHRLDCSKGCGLLAARRDAEGRPGVEVWRPRGDGTRQPLFASVSLVRDADGAVSEVVHSLRDITKLKEADEAKTLFLATASHELKTPLTVIQGYAQTLLRASPLEGWQEEEALEAIVRRAVELNRIIERLLLSSRIEAGRVHLTIEDVELEPVLRERVESLGGATGRDVCVELEATLPPVRADVNAITTVLDHLLDNAVKYSPDGGRITVAAVADGARARVTVADQGIGMDAEQAAKCFERFWQAESIDARRFAGTGIGLYIVRSMVEAMDGEVSVHSRPGQGSTFAVTLLRADAPGRPRSHEPEQPALVTSEPSVIREFMRQIGIPQRSGR